MIVESHSEPVLVADIGGTHARFALAAAPHYALTEVQVMRCAGHATLQDAALAYLAGLDQAARAHRPRRAALAIACVVDDEPVRMTNSPWVISRAAITAALGLSKLILLNDFEAIALSLPVLGPGELRPIGGGSVNQLLPMAAIGPGTGLGVALCVPSGGRWLAVRTEGGHATAVCADDFELEVLRAARREFEHVSTERLLSGIGLPVLYRAVAQVRGDQPLQLGAEQITQRAQQGSDAACAQTLETFFAMLGTFAGNVALGTGARGGVFIAGGIVQKLEEALVKSPFRARFEAKGRYQNYMTSIATRLITAPHCALVGAAQAMSATV